MNQFRLMGAWLIATLMIGCTVAGWGDGSSTMIKPMPEEAYWTRQGYSLDNVRDYMRETCESSNDAPTDTIERRRQFEQCMLNGGHVYMRDQYGLQSKGYAPLDKSRCAKGNPIAALPACRSIR